MCMLHTGSLLESPGSEERPCRNLIESLLLSHSSCSPDTEARDGACFRAKGNEGYRLKPGSVFSWEHICLRIWFFENFAKMSVQVEQTTLHAHASTFVTDDMLLEYDQPCRCSILTSICLVRCSAPSHCICFSPLLFPWFTTPYCTPHALTHFPSIGSLQRSSMVSAAVSHGGILLMTLIIPSIDLVQEAVPL